MESRKYVLCPEYLTGGSEGEIFIVKDGIYKKFRPMVLPFKRRRKSERLLYLEKIEELKNYYPNIRYLVETFFKQHLKGYVMSPIVGGELSSVSYYSSEKLKAIQELKAILALFRKYGLYYYDIRQPNVRLNQEHTPMLLDIDSILFEGEKVDAMPYFIKEYMSKGGKLDLHAQILMFNRFTMACFQQFDIENNLDVDSEGMEIMRDKKQVDSAFDHEYLCDHMKIKIV